MNSLWNAARTHTHTMLWFSATQNYYDWSPFQYQILIFVNSKREPKIEAYCVRREWFVAVKCIYTNKHGLIQLRYGRIDRSLTSRKKNIPMDSNSVMFGFREIWMAPCHDRLSFFFFETGNQFNAYQMRQKPSPSNSQWIFVFFRKFPRNERLAVATNRTSNGTINKINIYFVRIEHFKMLRISGAKERKRNVSIASSRSRGTGRDDAMQCL